MTRDEKVMAIVKKLAEQAIEQIEQWEREQSEAERDRVKAQLRVLHGP